LPVASVLLLPLAALVQAISWTATPFNPSSIPLAVRTPYLSAWCVFNSGVLEMHFNNPIKASARCWCRFERCVGHLLDGNGLRICHAEIVY
jgi:hypothetical protein